MKTLLPLLLSGLLAACSVPHLEPQNPPLPATPARFATDYMGFDKASVLFAAGIANTSYEHDPLTARLRLMDEKGYAMSCVDLVFLHKSDRRVLITSDDEKVFIAINGTETLADWYNDAKYVPYVSAGGSGYMAKLPPAHGGFRNLYAPIGNQIARAIKTSPCFRAPGPIYYAGHSLGAAFGILAAKVLCDHESVCFDGMFLFAPPLTVGAEVLADEKAYRKDKVISVQNHRDYVVRGGVRGTFVPAGQLYVIRGGALSRWEGPHIKYSWWEKLTLKVAKDHPMRRYIAAIESLPE